MPLRRARLVGVLALLGGAILFAQAPTASLVGVVHDTTGAVIPGATVALLNAGTNERRSVETTIAGEFSIVGLPPGTYNFIVQHDRFRTVKRDAMDLQIDQAARVEGTQRGRAPSRRPQIGNGKHWIAGTGAPTMTSINLC